MVHSRKSIPPSFFLTASGFAPFPTTCSPTVVPVHTAIHSLAMGDHVDLSLDSEDEDLQAAIRASLSNSTSSGGGGSSSDGMSNSNRNNSNNNSSGASSGASSASKRPHTDSSDPQRLGHGKRPRSWDELSPQPPLFRLLSTSPGDRASNGSVGLEDLLSGDFESALISNYLVDMGLMMQAQPRLGSVPVVVVHGDKG